VDDLDAIYRDYREMVYRFIYRMCSNANLAEELTQETFYQATRSWSHFIGKCNVSTWLCAIAKRLYYGSLRKPRELSYEDTSGCCEADVAESLLTVDRQMMAQRQLHCLPEPYREVFTLRTFCDLSHQQIGGLFGRSDSWARVTYYRARQMLAQAIKEEEEP
jgi:RNA polymerase sigma-70 factor, ECF subfamily